MVERALPGGGEQLAFLRVERGVFVFAVAGNGGEVVHDGRPGQFEASEREPVVERLERAKRIRDKVDCQLVYIGGCSTLASVVTLMREGFDFVQLGRALIKDPNFVNNALQQPDYDSGCTHCNLCAGMIEAPGGIRCPLNAA